MGMGKVTRLILFTVMTAAVAFGLAATTGAAWAQDEAGSSLDTIVVTGKTDGEVRSRSTATVWVIDEETIKKTNANSIVDLMATSPVGFLSEWTPGQTSTNIRGATTNGRGQDTSSQILVLLNGRPAGTANFAKLSPDDVHRIEIMRGPASVMYGSQAMGAVINIILKSGRNTEGGLVDARIGSAGLIKTHVEHATTWGENENIATYFGGSWSDKGNYESGKGGGEMVNTQWTRKSALGDLIWQVNEHNDLQLTVRSDGIYGVGFRGSNSNRYAKDDRFNQSLDLVWNFENPDWPIKWRLHNYMVYDEDYLKWLAPQSNTSKDYTLRRRYIMGTKFMSTINLSDTNELLLGVDLEKSKLDNYRERIDLAGNPVELASSANYGEEVIAFYAEDTQRFFDDRLILRGGLRYTRGETTLKPTHNFIQTLSSSDYQMTTWSVGANFAVTDNLSLRAGASTGFRAPSGSQLDGHSSGGGLNTSTANDLTYGNPDLDPESNLQYEIGMFLLGQGWYLDVALFNNVIENRLTTERVSSDPRISKHVNNENDVKVTGLEFDSRFDIDQFTDLGDWQLSFGVAGSYNFEMEDEDRTKANRNRNEIDRFYKYRGSIYTQFGQGGTVSNPWSVRLSGILRGPMYYDTEERLFNSDIGDPDYKPGGPVYEPHDQYIHRKSPFMVWNLSGELELSDQWTVYAGLNNLFDKNEHPVFMALDDGVEDINKPNHGGHGTSMPGREFYLGLKFAF